MRFLHMLRVFKPTSPLSVGSYILSPFSALTVAPRAARAAVVPGGAGAEAGPLDPAAAQGRGGGCGGLRRPDDHLHRGAAGQHRRRRVWHEPHDELPFLFAGSAMAAGGGLTMALTPVAEAGPSRKVAVTGAAIELAAMRSRSVPRCLRSIRRETGKSPL